VISGKRPRLAVLLQDHKFALRSVVPFGGLSRPARGEIKDQVGIGTTSRTAATQALPIN
jgi:hypothetical protein